MFLLFLSEYCRAYLLVFSAITLKVIFSDKYEEVIDKPCIWRDNYILNEAWHCSVIQIAWYTMAHLPIIHEEFLTIIIVIIIRPIGIIIQI